MSSPEAAFVLVLNLSLPVQIAVLFHLQILSLGWVFAFARDVMPTNHSCLDINTSRSVTWAELEGLQFDRKQYTI